MMPLPMANRHRRMKRAIKKVVKQAKRSEVPIRLDIPRQFSLVRFNLGDLPDEDFAKYPFKRNRVYVFFGEIANMPQHCVVADRETGRIYSGYHTDNFVELSDDEV